MNLKNMSVEEEVELKDLVAQTLKSNGTLAKIKAQLRASIFLALDEDEQISKQKPLLNQKIKSFMDSEEGKTMFYIVHEFLEFFNLFSTLSVYEPESYIECNYQQEEKQRLLNQFGLENIGDNNEPVLYKLIKIAQRSKKNLEVNINVNGNMHQENEPENTASESESISVTDMCSDSTSKEDKEINKPIKNGVSDPSLNSTFNVNSPLFFGAAKHNTNAISSQNNDICANSLNKKQNDGIFGDVSSISEDIDSVKVPETKTNGVDETETSKPKLSPPKSDKLKPKSNLSPLSDLPPLNKSRVSDILPSLYNKDFKEKSNLRELDKLFDMDADYEEDFMYSGDDLSLTSKEKTANLGKIEAKSKIPSRIIADCKFKTPVNAQKVKTNDATESESVASTSESL